MLFTGLSAVAGLAGLLRPFLTKLRLCGITCLVQLLRALATLVAIYVRAGDWSVETSLKDLNWPLPRPKSGAVCLNKSTLSSCSFLNYDLSNLARSLVLSFGKKYVQIHGPINVDGDLHVFSRSAVYVRGDINVTGSVYASGHLYTPRLNVGRNFLTSHINIDSCLNVGGNLVLDQSYGNELGASNCVGVDANIGGVVYINHRQPCVFGSLTAGSLITCKNVTTLRNFTVAEDVLCRDLKSHRSVRIGGSAVADSIDARFSVDIGRNAKVKRSLVAGHEIHVQGMCVASGLVADWGIGAGQISATTLRAREDIVVAERMRAAVCVAGQRVVAPASTSIGSYLRAPWGWITSSK